MDRRSWIRLITLAAVLFLAFGVPFWILGERFLGLSWWAFAALVLGYFVYFEFTYRCATSRRTRNLWIGLESDYPCDPFEIEPLKVSAGQLYSSHGDDFSGAVTLAFTEGLGIARMKNRGKIDSWAKIPWTQISKIELRQQDPELLDLVRERAGDGAVQQFMEAKLLLIRKTSDLNLIVPWSQNFQRHVPASVEIVEDSDSGDYDS